MWVVYFEVVCTVCHIAMRNDQRDAQFCYNQFIPQFLSALHVSNESSLSSSGTQNSVLYTTVQYNRAGPCTQHGLTIIN